MKPIQGLRDLVEDHDVFLVDLWGVLHDGTRPYEGVWEGLLQLKAAVATGDTEQKKKKKHIIALSNSSRRRDCTIRSLQTIFVDMENPDEFFDQIVTSGEVAFHMLCASSTSLLPLWWDKLPTNRNRNNNRKVMIVLGGGAQDDITYVRDCGWDIASTTDDDDDDDEACLVLCRGPYTIHDGSSVIDLRTDAAAYQQALSRVLEYCAKRCLPMVLTNPDKKSPTVEFIMPGQIGDLYEQALVQHGGVLDPKAWVKRIGKPFSEVYDWALRDVSNIPKSRICMLGDALETDMTGGTRAGIHTAWVVKDGIHRTQVNGLEQSGQVVEEFRANSQNTYASGLAVQPDFVMEHFQW
eukprot:scaffold4060_cov190-Amphora_coffeaeformis.AAC.12